MAAYFCPHCKVWATFADQGPGVTYAGRVHHIWTCNKCTGVVYAQVRTEPDDVIIYPFVRAEAPEEYPDEVRENFAEAIRSMNANNPKAAVIMTRSALQAAAREQGAVGKTLEAEIEDLAARHVIPASLQDWAHELRDGGNLVVHPEPGKKVEMADAEELLALAESIFEYLYVVPKQVERRRQRLKEQEEAATE